MELEARYRDHGLEIIGVSLNQNPEDVRRFVAEREINWPQFVVAEGLKSEFTSRWGIHAIPQVFVVDQEGNLNSINARGREEEIILELLNRK